MPYDRLKAISSSIFFAFAALAAFSVHGAPPVGGFPTIEESVPRYCKDFEVVVVAKMIRVREEVWNGEIWETAELSVDSILKGSEHRVPGTYSLPKVHPNRTDQRGPFETGMTYLMFLRPGPSLGLGWEGHIVSKLSYELLGDPALPLEKRRMEKTDTFFQYTLSLVRKFCP